MSKEFSMGGPQRGAHHRNLMKNEKDQLHNPRTTIKRLITYIGKKKFLLALIFFFAVLTTLITVIGTQLNGYTIDKFIQTKNMSGLFFICIIMIIMYVISTISTFFQNRIMVNVAQQTSANLRKDLFVNMQKLPLKYFDTHSSGDLMSRLTNDIDNINMTLSQSITQLFSGIVMILGMLIAMFIVSPLLTVVGLLVMPLTFLTTRVIIKKTQPYFVRQQKELGAINGFIEEKVSGQKAILLFSQEEHVKKEFAVINERLTANAIRAQIYSGIIGPVNNFINNLTYLILAVCGGYFIISGMEISVGVIFTIILFMRNFTRPINEILSIVNLIQSALAGAERVFAVIDESKEDDEKKETQTLPHVSGDVTLSDVVFAYKEDKPVLKGISLTANKGQTIAIVGPTGSGKTTIINLLTRFYDIDSGEITIDGVNINKLNREFVRKSIGMVLQDTYLFSVTVRENIRYGRLSASDKEVEEAAKLANAHHFIMHLPNGYDTVLTDNGSNLSHGQRQLLAIARAIVSDCSVLILDEATSSIDTRTEVAIQNAMMNLMKGKTSFIIAHRLSTIRHVDLIIAIKDGEIIERGTHEELLEKQGFYANLYNSQFKTGISL